MFDILYKAGFDEVYCRSVDQVRMLERLQRCGGLGAFF